MRMFLVVTLILSSAASATETRPTGATAISPQQKQTHKKVRKLQKKLARELEAQAPPAQIGKTKAKLQKERTKANGADAIQDSSPEHGIK
ncbi:MAG: hypothetical protein EOP06_14180 [Proteobacteria bacterium]|nr:MAG: hypothetical protein EOP06_14180 [Pseudomonadota bacterium]